MTTYTQEEIREGRKVIDELTELLNQIAWRLTVEECCTDREAEEVNQAVENIRLLAWNIVFPKPTPQQIYDDLKHLWQIDQTTH